MTRINWNDLQYFLAQARRGSPYEAALQLGVDHTTVRRRVGALEEALKAKLFDIRRGQQELTPQGQRLVAVAEELELRMEAVTTEVSDATSSVSGVVRIGAPDGFGSVFLAPRLARLQQQHPELTIELIAVSRQLNLAKRESDIAIAVDRPSKGHQVIRKLADCYSILYASAEYLDAHAPIRSIHDLKDHSFVGYVEDFPFVIDFFPDVPDYQMNSHARFTSTNMIAQLRATVAGAGLCLLPRYMVEGEPSLRPVLPSETQVCREIWLTVHPEIKDFARIRVVSQFIREEVAAHRELFL
jgi:DNA-binding transcriptional LysR family regulator